MGRQLTESTSRSTARGETTTIRRGAQLSRYKRAARVVLALFVAVTGVLHFAKPEFFVAIVPAYLPWPLALVYVSGAAELAGATGMFIRRTRGAAGVGLALLFIAVFPANVNMAIHHIAVNGARIAPALLWARLALQPLLVVWAIWGTRDV